MIRREAKAGDAAAINNRYTIAELTFSMHVPLEPALRG
jgi:hypothetical protein